MLYLFCIILASSLKIQEHFSIHVYMIEVLNDLKIGEIRINSLLCWHTITCV